MDAAPAARPRFPADLSEPFRSVLAAATEAWSSRFGERIVSLVLIGSVARAAPRPSSDIDLLVIAEGLPRSLRDRRRPFLEEWERTRSAGGLPSVTWNLVPMSPAEARTHSPLYLDLVEDGVVLLDRGGFFESVPAELRARMRALGSRRVFPADGSWYWDLKPDFRFGEVVEL